MQAYTFWKMITMDHANLLERLIVLFDEHGIRYCVNGGQAVNAYAEPLVSLDLDLVETILPEGFTVSQFPHSINISIPGSDVRVQIQTDPRYADFVSRAVHRKVLGLDLPVASLEDVLQGKI